MKIEKLRLSHLRNEEWFQFFMEFRTLIGNQNGDDLPVEEQLPLFEKLLEDADNAMEQIRESIYTKPLAEADSMRATVFVGFRDTVKATQVHFDPLKRQAAVNLMIVFNSYGNIARKGYSEATASYYNFTQEMKSERFAGDVETLGLTDWVTKLNEANSRFEALTMERLNEQSQKSPVSVADLRKQVDKCYAGMVERIEALTVIYSEHKLEPFVNQLNANVRRYKAALSHREGKPKPADTPGTETEVQ